MTLLKYFLASTMATTCGEPVHVPVCQDLGCDPVATDPACADGSGVCACPTPDSPSPVACIPLCSSLACGGISCDPAGELCTCGPLPSGNYTTCDATGGL